MCDFFHEFLHLDLDTFNFRLQISDFTFFFIIKEPEVFVKKSTENLQQAQSGYQLALESKEDRR